MFLYFLFVCLSAKVGLGQGLVNLESISFFLFSLSFCVSFCSWKLCFFGFVFVFFAIFFTSDFYSPSFFLCFTGGEGGGLFCLFVVGWVSGFFVVVWLFVFCIYLLFLRILLLIKFKTVQCLGSLQGHFMYLDP